LKLTENQRKVIKDKYLRDAKSPEEWLRAALADGPMPAGDVYAAAATAGITKATLRRASKRVGVEARKTGLRGGWAWGLPGCVWPDAEEEAAEGEAAEGEARDPTEPGGAPGDDASCADTTGALAHLGAAVRAALAAPNVVRAAERMTLWRDPVVWAPLVAEWRARPAEVDVALDPLRSTGLGKRLASRLIATLKGAARDTAPSPAAPTDATDAPAAGSAAGPPTEGPATEGPPTEGPATDGPPGDPAAPAPAPDTAPV
jgi:hypothetical protein